MPHVHAPGLVLRFDPQTLAADGASYTGNDEVEFSTQQYFVCIEANPKEALWVPLFAGPSEGRKGIAASAKSGNSRWVRYTSYWDPAQLCRISHKAAQHAATVAYDDSTPKAPNRLAAEQLPARSAFPADDQFRPMAGNIAVR